MTIWNAFVDFANAVNRQNIARGFARKFIRAVTGANGNRQCIALRELHKLRRLINIGQ